MAITGELTAMGQDMGAIGGAFGAVAPEADSLGEAIKMTFATGGANNLWIIVGVIVSLLIMVMGVAGGIEKSCKIMIPALYVLFIALAVLMIFTPGTSEGYKYIFTLNPEGLKSPEVWVYAFGQCFFSLSVAGSGSVVYLSLIHIYTLFVAIKVGRSTLSGVMPYMLWYYVAILVGLLLVTYVPFISLGLPMAAGLL